MKKIVSLSLVFSMAISLAASGNVYASTTTGKAADEESSSIPDLTGEWTQVNSASEDMYQYAIITEDTIEIYWVFNDDDTEALYWSGTFVAPTTADEPYTWDSVNDHDTTDMALMASGDDTKTITYEDGQISYEGSILGTTSTYKLEKTADLSEIDAEKASEALVIGIDILDIIDLLPEEDLYDHKLDQEETEGMISSTAKLMFYNTDEESYPGLEYTSEYTASTALFVWTFSYSFTELILSAIDGDESSINTWDSLSDLMLALSSWAETSLSLTVADDYHGLIMLLGEDGNVILASYKEEILYDAVAAMFVPSDEAIEAAQEYLEEHPNFRNRGDLIASLEIDGYSTQEAAAAAEYCGADWNALAVESAESWLSSIIGFTYDDLVEELEWEEFTSSEIDYALKEIDPDWNEQAVIMANTYIENDEDQSRDRDNIVDVLKISGFTDEQAEYGADHCDGYWNK